MHAPQAVLQGLRSTPIHDQGLRRMALRLLRAPLARNTAQRPGGHDGDGQGRQDLALRADQGHILVQQVAPAGHQRLRAQSRPIGEGRQHLMPDGCLDAVSGSRAGGAKERCCAAARGDAPGRRQTCDRPVAGRPAWQACWSYRSAHRDQMPMPARWHKSATRGRRLAPAGRRQQTPAAAPRRGCPSGAPPGTAAAAPWAAAAGAPPPRAPRPPTHRTPAQL